MSDTNERAFQEIQCETSKLTLINREKGIVLLDLQATPEQSLIGTND